MLGGRDYATYSWLNFFAAGIFALESLLDFVWGLLRWYYERKLAQCPESSNHVTMELPSSKQPRPERCLPWLDKVHWDVWIALWFLIPSVLYFMESLLDPNVVVLSWLNFMSSSGMSNAVFISWCDKVGGYAFVYDAILSLLGRYSSIRGVAPAERLVVFQFWKARFFLEFDWGTWSEPLFCLGAAFQLWGSYKRAEWLDWSCNCIWLVNAICVSFACFPTFLLLRSEQQTLKSARET